MFPLHQKLGRLALATSLFSTLMRMSEVRWTSDAMHVDFNPDHVSGPVVTYIVAPEESSVPYK
jgi:hypothetical protein